MNDHQKGVAAICLAAFLWSTGGLFIKLVPLPALPITTYRSLFAMGVFALLFGKKVLKMNARMWLNSLFYAATLLCFVSATKMTTAANAIFLQFSFPIYVLLLEPKLFGLRLERVNLWTVFACLAGMALFFVDGLVPSCRDGFQGNLLALFCGLTFAGFLLGQRLNDPDTHLAAIFWGNFLVILVSSGAFLEAPWPGWPAFGMLAFLGIFQIGVAYALFSFGLKRTLAIEASLLSFIEPILNPVWVWLGYGERPSNWAMLGGLVILTALIFRTVFLERLAKKNPCPNPSNSGT